MPDDYRESLADWQREIYDKMNSDMMDLIDYECLLLALQSITFHVEHNRRL